MENLARTLSKLRMLGGDDWRLRQIILFTRIARAGHDGITLPALCEEFGISQQAVDRSCKAMALMSRTNLKTKKKEIVGLDLIEYTKDFVNHGAWNVRLTQKGLKSWNELCEIYKSK